MSLDLLRGQFTVHHIDVHPAIQVVDLMAAGTGEEALRRQLLEGAAAVLSTEPQNATLSTEPSVPGDSQPEDTTGDIQPEDTQPEEGGEDVFMLLPVRMKDQV